MTVKSPTRLIPPNPAVIRSPFMSSARLANHGSTSSSFAALRALLRCTTVPPSPSGTMMSPVAGSTETGSGSPSSVTWIGRASGIFVCIAARVFVRPARQPFGNLGKRRPYVGGANQGFEAVDFGNDFRRVAPFQQELLFVAVAMFDEIPQAVETIDHHFTLRIVSRFFGRATLPLVRSEER